VCVFGRPHCVGPTAQRLGAGVLAVRRRELAALLCGPEMAAQEQLVRVTSEQRQRERDQPHISGSSWMRPEMRDDRGDDTNERSAGPD